MIYIGCHLTVTEGYAAMCRTMCRFGGNTFAWFTRNPRGGKTKPVDREDVESLCRLIQQEALKGGFNNVCNDDRQAKTADGIRPDA